jgi:hypothetical protein
MELKDGGRTAGIVQPSDFSVSPRRVLASCAFRALNVSAMREDLDVCSNIGIPL